MASCKESIYLNQDCDEFANEQKNRKQEKDVDDKTRQG